MNPNIDLHIHSEYSDDGELPVGRILQLCREKNMDVVAICDHNSVEGVPEALEHGKRLGVRVLPGVELDCRHNGRSYHLLGYGFDHTLPQYREIGLDILRQEQAAAPERIRRFQRATGIPVPASAVMARAENGVVPGELIAELVLADANARQHTCLRPYLPGGEKSDMPLVWFYWDFFAAGKPAHVPFHYISLAGAAALIHRSGGMAVLAHPGQNLKGDFSPLDDILRQGVDGIEVFSSYHSPEDVRTLAAIAKKRRVAVTAGSDFHGQVKPRIQIGGHGAEQYPEAECLLRGLVCNSFGK